MIVDFSWRRIPRSYSQISALILFLYKIITQSRKNEFSVAYIFSQENPKQKSFEFSLVLYMMSSSISEYDLRVLESGKGFSSLKQIKRCTLCHDDLLMDFSRSKKIQSFSISVMISMMQDMSEEFFGMTLL